MVSSPPPLKRNHSTNFISPSPCLRKHLDDQSKLGVLHWNANEQSFFKDLFADSWYYMLKLENKFKKLQKYANFIACMTIVSSFFLALICLRNQPKFCFPLPQILCQHMSTYRELAPPRLDYVIYVWPLNNKNKQMYI